MASRSTPLLFSIVSNSARLKSRYDKNFCGNVNSSRRNEPNEKKVEGGYVSWRIAFAFEWKKNVKAAGWSASIFELLDDGAQSELNSRKEELIKINESLFSLFPFSIDGNKSNRLLYRLFLRNYFAN